MQEVTSIKTQVTDAAGNKFNVEARCLEAVDVWPIKAKRFYGTPLALRRAHFGIVVEDGASQIELVPKSIPNLIAALQEAQRRLEAK